LDDCDRNAAETHSPANDDFTALPCNLPLAATRPDGLGSRQELPETFLTSVLDLRDSLHDFSNPSLSGRSFPFRQELKELFHTLVERTAIGSGRKHHQNKAGT
jgi:hypothetical protein